MKKNQQNQQSKLNKQFGNCLTPMSSHMKSSKDVKPAVAAKVNANTKKAVGIKGLI